MGILAFFKRQGTQFLLLIPLIAIILLITRQKSNPAIPLSFSERGYPMVGVTISGHAYPLELQLASKYSLFLPSEILSKLKTREKGTATWRTPTGENFSSSLFELKGVKISNSVVLQHPVAAAEKQNSEIGQICWPLEEVSLLLDFPHGRIWPIKSQRDLEKAGINLNRMLKVKYHVLNKGVLFEGKLNNEPLRFTLSMSCNRSFINQLNSKDSESVEYNMSIGDCQFGKISVGFFTLTPELEFDVVLGQDFLKNHLVFIDSTSHHLYIGEKNANRISSTKLQRFQLFLDKAQRPCLKMKIGQKQCIIGIDSGQETELSFRADKYPLSSGPILSEGFTVNGLGKKTPTTWHYLNSCQIGKSTAHNVLVGLTESDNCVSLDIKSSDCPYDIKKPDGFLGLPFLRRLKPFLDFRNRSLWVSATPEELEKTGREFTTIPIEFGKGGILIQGTTEQGPLNILLDTGASVSLFNKKLSDQINLSFDEQGNEVWNVRSLKLGEIEFSSQKLYPVEMSDYLTEEIDGVLGMDFLLNRGIYIDFDRNEILLEISPSQSNY